MQFDKKKTSAELRSYRWLGRDDLRSFGHRSRLQQMGYDRADWAGKPVIGIINTWSDINACHGHLLARAEDVKRGIVRFVECNGHCLRGNERKSFTARRYRADVPRNRTL